LVLIRSRILQVLRARDYWSFEDLKGPLGVQIMGLRRNQRESTENAGKEEYSILKYQNG